MNTSSFCVRNCIQKLEKYNFIFFSQTGFLFCKGRRTAHWVFLKKKKKITRGTYLFILFTIGYIRLTRSCTVQWLSILVRIFHVHVCVCSFFVAILFLFQKKKKRNKKKSIYFFSFRFVWAGLSLAYVIVYEKTYKYMCI